MKPLDRRRILVLRAAHQAPPTIKAFRRAGAEVVTAPLLEIAAPTDPAPFRKALETLDEYKILVLTSANAGRAVAGFERPGIEVRPLPTALEIAVIGPATAAAVDSLWQREPRWIPEDQRAEGLLSTLKPVVAGQRVLLPQAEDARPILAEGLRALGAELDAVVAYRKGLPAGARDKLQQLFRHGRNPWVVFTSPSTVHRFQSGLGAHWPAVRDQLVAISIGPVTSKALTSAGAARIFEAQNPDDASLVAAARRVKGGKGRR